MALNTEQQRAVECEDNLLILAPPGSGKTGTLVAKAKHIIVSHPTSVVYLVTFTEASSKEAHERIAKALTPQQMSRVRCATFHKHAIQQLRQSDKLGQILTPRQSSDLLKKALRVVESSMDPMEAEERLQAAKATPDYTGNEDDFIREYESLKAKHRALDLQDLTRECVWGMRTSDANKSVAPLPATHLMCDEFQDVDWNQLHWLLEYYKTGTIVTVVGDDDQSVYGWRSSLGYDAMDAFIGHTKPTVINLEINYRSRSEVLESATSLIRNNTKRMPKNILSQRGPGGAVVVANCADVEEAAERVAAMIIGDARTFKENAAKIAEYDFDSGNDAELDVAKPLLRWRLPLGRWGIIGRTNRDLWLVSSMLRNQNIPHNKSASKDGPPEIMLFCNFLVSLQTGDVFGLEQVLAAIGISHKAIDTIHERMGDDFFTLMDGELPEMDGLLIEDSKAIREFSETCSKWRSLLNVQRGDKFVAQYKRVIDTVGYYFTTTLIRNEDVQDDFAAFVDMLKKAKGPLHARIQAFLRPEESKATAGVSLCTMHSSKGLEFDNVVVINCNSGSVPSVKSKSVEEERRLFYVAMTRARHNLWLMYIATKGPSVFLSEIGAVERQ